MKKSIIILIVLFSLCACDTNEPKTYEQVETHMFSRLSSLRGKYSGNSASYNVRHAKMTDEETTELSSEEKLQVAKADMEGFAVGAAVGGSAGAAIGTLVSPVGGAVGGIAGGAAIGAAYAAVWSKEEANSIRSEHDEEISLQDLYSIDQENPINDFTYSSPLFNTSIKWANIGLLHNYILSAIYNQDSSSFFDIPADQMMDNIFTSYFCPTDGNEDRYYDLYDYSINNINRDYYLMHADSAVVGLDSIVSFYFSEIEAIPEDSLFAYTEEFMAIVYEELEQVDEDRVFLINGCLSTFFYSKCLWNLNIPSRNSGRYLVLNTENESWCYVETPDVQQWYQMSIAGGDSVLIFVPRVRNAELKSLFLFDFWQTSQLSYIEGNHHIVTTEGIPTLVLEDENIVEITSTEEYVFIPSGSYALQRFEGGYFVSIY